MTRTALALALLAIALVAFPSASSAVPPPKDRYIVVLNDSVSDPGAVARAHGRRYGVRHGLVYRAALKGYVANIPAARVDSVRRDPNVDYVEPDGVAHASATAQPSATWGLDRIDQRAGLDTFYTYSAAGSGVTAYVIDTGIRTTHTDFEGRASRSNASDFVSPKNGGDDCDGHGTHVAGTIGGKTWGVAKGVSLVAVRVLDCSGSGYWSWVIAGIDWVTANAAKPAVANMSLGGGANSSVDQAVANSVGAGVSYAVAAGNDGRDACRFSPARTADALTVGATDRTDTRARWSNWGSCVDWFSPGVSITSAHRNSDTATATWSGTSMAAPHTAGAAALYLEGSPAATPAQVRTAIWDALTVGIVADSKTTYNHLLYTLFGTDGGGTTDPGGSEPPPGEDPPLDEDPPPDSGDPAFDLTATGSKVKGWKSTQLSWTGTEAAVDVYRDASRIATGVTGGSYLDADFGKGGGVHRYQVCESGASTVCSDEESVSF